MPPFRFVDHLDRTRPCTVYSVQAAPPSVPRLDKPTFTCAREQASKQASSSGSEVLGQLSGRRASLPTLKTADLAPAALVAPAALAFSRSSSSREVEQLSSRGDRGSLLALETTHLAAAALAFSRKSNSGEMGQLSSRGRRGFLPALRKRRLSYESLGSIDNFLARGSNFLNETKARSGDSRSAPLL